VNVKGIKVNSSTLWTIIIAPIIVTIVAALIRFYISRSVSEADEKQDRLDIVEDRLDEMETEQSNIKENMSDLSEALESLDENQSDIKQELQRQMNALKQNYAKIDNDLEWLKQYMRNGGINED
jgi:peptidoglycan hydrolase CwlO-like protein